MVNTKAREYVIFTDATADLTAAIADDAEILIIPMIVDVDGKEYSFSPQEGEISIEDFYRRLEAGESVRTSQINQMVYRQHFEERLKAGQDVLYIGFSSGLSGSIQVAEHCAVQLREVYPQRQILCIDTLCASTGEGLLVYVAARKRQAGMAMVELAAWLEENKYRLCHWFTIDEFTYLQRGGRISAAAATVGAMLNIKPVLHVNDEGKLVSISKVRGRRKSIEALAEAFFAYHTGGPEETVFIGHGTALEEAAGLRQIIMERSGAKDVRLLPIGPVVGAHTGPGVMGVFFFGAKR